MTKHRARLAVATLASMLVFTGCTSGSSTSEPPAPQPGPAPTSEPVLTTPNVTEDMLFVARGVGGTLDLDSKGVGTLTMEQVPTMTWFSDRPDHDAGTTATVDALKSFGWTKDGDGLGEGTMAPNAALLADNLTDTVVMELLAVVVEGDDIVFKVKAETDVSEDQRQVDLGGTELFIDSVEPLAVGTVVGSIRAGLPYKGSIMTRGVMVVTGDVILTADGKQAVNLTLRPFWNTQTKQGFDNEKILVTLTEDNPVTPPGQGIPFVSVEYDGIRFYPADPAAGVPTAKLRVYTSTPGFEEVMTSYRP